MKIIVTGFFLFAILTTSFCQDQDFIPGYYINQHGDTTFGTFPRKPKPGFLAFKFSLPSQKQSSLNIQIDSCRELVCGAEYYKIWYGARSMVYAENINLDVLRNIDSFKVGFIPIKLVYKGAYISLYEFTDERPHFFIEFNDSIQELLIAYRYSDFWEKIAFPRNNPTYIITPIYRDQLNQIIGNKSTTRIKNMIDECTYDLFAIERVVKKIDRKLKAKNNP